MDLDFSRANEKPRVGLISYFLNENEVLIFLIKKDFKDPKVFRKTPDNNCNVIRLLELCAQRLVADFNGVDPNWRDNEFISPSEKQILKESLNLEPGIEEFKRYRSSNYPGTILLSQEKMRFYKFMQTYLDIVSELVFPSELKQNLEDCDLLCITPHGPLHALPLHALKWNLDESFPQYLIEKFGVCYVPSIATLKYCQNKNPFRQNQYYKPRNCLVVCSGKKDDYQKFEQDIKHLESLWTNKDISILGIDSGNHLSSKNSIIKNISNKDVIHFSTHGFFATEHSRNPLDSGLIVAGEDGSVYDYKGKKSDEILKSDYIINAKEIFNLKLNATLVTLRACSSGRSVIEKGDELLGLTRALLYAGSSSLIASLWNVNIESSRKLLLKFYELWLDSENPLPKWKAFQEAQLSFISKDKEKYSNIYHWAPFVLIGDWL